MNETPGVKNLNSSSLGSPEYRETVLDTPAAATDLVKLSVGESSLPGFAGLR